MGLLSRLMMLIRAKLTRVVDEVEHPPELMDYSYEKQIELQQTVRRGIVEVVTARQRLERELGKLNGQVAKLDDQARQALALGREDLARLALERKQVAAAQTRDLEAQLGELTKEQERLQEGERQLALRVEAFRTRKEVIKAQYAAAEAQVRISEAVTGLSGEFAEIGQTIRRAEDKTERLRSRAAAIEELAAVGTLEDLVGGRDLVERELAQLTAAHSVEAELAELKRQLQPSTPPKELGPGTGGPSA